MKMKMKFSKSHKPFFLYRVNVFVILDRDTHLAVLG